jgi:carbamate kinase
MGPKVEAAAAFAASDPGRVAVIGALGDLEQMLEGACGTRISQDVPDLLLA